MQTPSSLFDLIPPDVVRVRWAFAGGAATHGSPEADPHAWQYALALLMALLTLVVMVGAAR